MIRRWCLLFCILLLWIPITAAQDNNSAFIEHVFTQYETLNTVGLQYNVCPETIEAANQTLAQNVTDTYSGGLRGLNPPEGVIIQIPIHSEPCFESFILESGTRILDFLQDNNVCINDYLAYNDDFPIHYELPEIRTIHLRLDVPPCYEDGQRRIFTVMVNY